MIRRIGQLVARIRGGHQAVAVYSPPRRLLDELGEAALDAAAWIARRQSAAVSYVSRSDQTIDRLSGQYPDLVDATVKAARRVLRHEFDLLGSGPYVPLDPDRPADASGYQPIDWYLDPVSGLRFPRGVPLAQWNFERMRPGRADIKLPWELARCQHWPLLGQAFQLTGQDQYAIEIARELADFMEANPVGIGVNWTCTMDVALRAANWALALDLVQSCASLTPVFWRQAYEALFDHGVFIAGHLENHYEVTSNHFLSDVVGLFYLAAVFGDLPLGAVWDRQCRDWLGQEFDVQVLADGADFESSVPYHRLVTELFLGAARLAEHRGRPLPAALLDRLATMVDFLAAVLRPDGLMPQVGDADDGRLQILSGYGRRSPQDPRHLFGPAAGFFRSDRWDALIDREAAWEAEWWGYESATPRDRAAAPASAVRHYPDAGVTVLRDPRQYLLITNGIVGTRGFGNHKHNDLLSFEYHVHGRPVIVDPGSFVYTSDPEARNLFRSTRFHNGVSVDEEEQNEYRPEWLFRMFEKARPEHLAVIERVDAAGYRGRHHGYTRLPQPVLHDRTFTLSWPECSLRIVDHFDGTGTHRLRWHFHFAPDVTVECRSPRQFDVAVPGRLRLTVPPGLRAATVPSWYSPSYGVRRRAIALEFETDEQIDAAKPFVFEFRWADTLGEGSVPCEP